MRCCCSAYCGSGCLVCHAHVAAKFFVQNQFNLVDFCCLRIVGVRNRAADCELAELASRNQKPGGKFEIRIGIQNLCRT